MRFFLVSRDRSTGDVRLVSDGTYATRDEALGVIGASGGSQDMDANDLFVVDLDAVTPVVMYQAPAAAAAPLVPEPLDEPIADVWEAPDETEPAPQGDTAFGGPASAQEEAAEGRSVAVEEPTAFEGLAETETPDAEEEAPVADDETAPVEDETAPVDESVEEELQPLALEPPPGEPMVGGAPQIEARDPVSAQSLVVDETPDDLADALRRAASQMEGAGIVAPPSVEEFAYGNADVAVDEPAPEQIAPADEPAPVPTAPADEPAAWPWEAEPPMSEAPGTDAASEPALEVLASPSAETLDPDPPIYVPVGIEEPGLEEITLLTPAEPSAFEEPYPGETDGAEQPPVKAYEPGELDISAYTCDDCVYVATCPKNHQEGPATCGAFQWKPA